MLCGTRAQVCCVSVRLSRTPIPLPSCKYKRHSLFIIHVCEALARGHTARTSWARASHALASSWRAVVPPAGARL
eukprot:2985227-Alexandrium_andersonii.AAC.1